MSNECGPGPFMIEDDDEETSPANQPAGRRAATGGNALPGRRMATGIGDRLRALRSKGYLSRGFLILAMVVLFVFTHLAVKGARARFQGIVARLPALTEQNFAREVTGSTRLPVLIFFHWGSPEENLIDAAQAIDRRGEAKAVALNVEQHPAVADEIDPFHVIFRDELDGWVIWNGKCFSSVYTDRPIHPAGEADMEWSVKNSSRCVQ